MDQPIFDEKRKNVELKNDVHTKNLKKKNEINWSMTCINVDSHFTGSINTSVEFSYLFFFSLASPYHMKCQSFRIHNKIDRTELIYHMNTKTDAILPVFILFFICQIRSIRLFILSLLTNFSFMNW